ncbi:hypothetical protein B7P43_G06550, partial [Cryptotermes secundus]
QVSQKERSIFWEVIVSVILSKKLYMYMCPIPNSFRDTAISLYSTLTLNTVHCTLYRRATRHVLTRGAKCIVFDGGIFENILY